MTDSNNSQRWLRQHLSRRAALRAAILGASIPGALYLAKAANSADAADDNIYIPGAPNFLELGHGWPGKEANAGKITYGQWSDALDIVGAGTTAGYRKVKIWDDLYVQGLLNLRAYIVDPEVPRTWTAFLYAKDVNGQSKPFWKDATGTAQPLVARSATLIVAASNASPRSKLGADYVCDGTADEVEINAALAALPTGEGGGVVQLTEGEFTPAATITVGNFRWLRGMGQNTKITSGTALAPAISMTGGRACVTDIRLGGSTYTIGISMAGERSELRNVQIENIGGSGVKLLASNENFLQNVYIDNCNVGIEIAAGCWDTRLSNVWIGGDGSGPAPADGILCAGGAGSVQASNLHIFGYPDHVDLSGAAWQFCFSNCWFMGGPGTERCVHMHANAGGGAGEIFFDHCRFSRGSDGVTGTTPDVDIVETTFAGAFTNIRFSGCRFQYDAGSQSVAAIRLNSTHAESTAHGPIQINDCQFDTGYSSGPIVVAAGTSWNLKAYDNEGYVTENGGAASIADGGTINHGLAITPVYVTAVGSVAGEIVSVTAKGSSTFSVAIKKHDGTAGTPQTIYWRAWA